MNVRLIRSITWVVFLCLILSNSGVYAQGGGGYKHLMTAKNLIGSDTISGVNMSVYIVSPQAKHGDVALQIIQSGGSGNPYVYQVKYTPDPGYVGLDTFTLELNFAGSYPYLTYLGYRVTVYPSLLNLKPDFAVTTVGNPVTVDVLANDSGTSGPLTLASLPLVDHGTASINGAGQVVFTPKSGFAGVAQVQYQACDAVGFCRTASLSVGVNSGANPGNDTLRIATAKNTKITMPLSYSGYTLFQSPANGSVTIQNGQSFRYSPNSNFTGTDQFVLANTGFNPTVYKTILVDVLNAPTPNTMAMDDYAFTPKGAPITLNVLDNDIGNLKVKSWIAPPAAQGTLSGMSGNGTVTFTPNPNFTGVATFSYKIGNLFVPDLETAQVNVVVSNLNPAQGTYNLTTPRQTPLVINYAIPFIGFDFAITDAPDEGTCSFYPGFSTHTINGQTVSGYNLLIYTPDNGFSGTDEFEVDYCVSSNGQCKSVKIVVDVLNGVGGQAPYCVADCVWAGDINSDGIVNHKDLLPLGYLMGYNGLTRPNATLEWYGQGANDWNNPFAHQPFDLKHADTDGDGTVNAADTLALSYFYGQVHNLIPTVPPLNKGLPFSFQVLTPDAGVGDLMQIRVKLGSNSLPVTNLYGFTLDVQLSPTVLDSGLRMEYYDNSWLNLNAPFLTLSKNPRQGKLETAFTRTNGDPTHGFGAIGQFEFIIIDIIDGAKPESREDFTLTITVEPQAQWGDGVVSAGDKMILEIPIKRQQENIIRPSQSDDFIVSPSPALDRVRFYLNGADQIESLTVCDLSGRVLYSGNDIQREETWLDVSSWPPGIYIAAARTTSGMVTKRFVKG